jgi:cytidylate kinase
MSGRRGSGKSTLSWGVAEKLSWQRAGFGDYVRSEAKRIGLDDSLETLQAVGEKLVMQGPETFCRAVLYQAGWESGTPLVIDGIRHAEIVEALRSIVAPAEFRLVHVSVEEAVRESRLLARDKTGREESRQYDMHSTERQVDSLSRLADLIVDGNLPEIQIINTITRWVHHLASNC